MADRLVDIVATAEPLVLTVSGGSGGVTGLSPTVALRDASSSLSTPSYLDFNDNTFKTSGWTTKYASMTEIERGHYQRNLDVSALPSVAAGDVYVAEYRVAEGSTFIDVHDLLRVVATLHTIAAPGDAMDLVADAVDAAAIATGAIDADAIAAGAIGASEAPNLDAAVSSRAAPGAAMDLVAGAVDAAAIATNAIDADAIAPGAIGVSEAPNLDAAVSSRESEASAATRATTNQTEHDATQALIAALNDLSIANVQTALTSQGYTVVRAALLDNLDEAVSAAKTLTAAERDAVANALLDLTNAIETGFNLRGAVRIIAAVVAGLSSGGPAQQVFKGLDEVTTRADISSDGSGNRTTIGSYVP